MDSKASQAQVGLEPQIRAARSCPVSCCRNLEIQRLVFLSKVHPGQYLIPDRGQQQPPRRRLCEQDGCVTRYSLLALGFLEAKAFYGTL